MLTFDLPVLTFDLPSHFPAEKKGFEVDQRSTATRRGADLLSTYIDL